MKIHKKLRESGEYRKTWKNLYTQKGSKRSIPQRKQAKPKQLATLEKLWISMFVGHHRKMKIKQDFVTVLCWHHTTFTPKKKCLAIWFSREFFFSECHFQLMSQHTKSHGLQTWATDTGQLVEVDRFDRQHGQDFYAMGKMSRFDVVGRILKMW